MFQLDLLLGLGQQLKPIHVGHINVADDEVESRTAELLQRHYAVFCLVRIDKTTLFKEVTHDAAHRGEIINN